MIALDVSDTSKKLLDKAIHIAKLSDAKITGINVVVVQSTLASAVINYKKFLTNKAEKTLDLTKKYCEKQGIQFTSKVRYGSPAAKITELAEKQKVDLIVIGSKGLGGVKGTILGSVANSVVHKSKVSVLVVK